MKALTRAWVALITVGAILGAAALVDYFWPSDGSSPQQGAPALTVSVIADVDSFEYHGADMAGLLSSAMASPAGDDGQLVVLNTKGKVEIFFPKFRLYTGRILVIRKWVVDGEVVGDTRYHTDFAAWLDYEPVWPRAIYTTYFSSPKDQEVPG